MGWIRRVSPQSSHGRYLQEISPRLRAVQPVCVCVGPSIAATISDPQMVRTFANGLFQILYVQLLRFRWEQFWRHTFNKRKNTRTDGTGIPFGTKIGYD